MTAVEAIYKLVLNVQTMGGFAAAIAIMITGTLCLSFLFSPSQREYVGRALILLLTTIVGFYFGTHAPEKMSNPISIVTQTSAPNVAAPAQGEQPKAP